MENKENLLVLIGPTAVGKTAISIDLAKKINGEIISADSMQIYRYMDIGTAKVKLDEMENIPHYLIDIINPDEKFTVSQYKNKTNKYIHKINEKSKIPMIVGGTGLYINSIVYELGFANVKPNNELRKKYNNTASLYGNKYLYDNLYAIDSESAQNIHPNDRKRIIRALEIFYQTGKPMSQYNKNFRAKTNKYNLAMFGLTMDRSKLYSRINKRVDLMIDNGLIDEVHQLLDMGYTKELVSMKGIGYKEIIPYIEGKTNLNDAINILKRNTRRYAKRQLTWFRRDDRIRWVNVDEFDSINSIVAYIMKHMKSLLVLS